MVPIWPVWPEQNDTKVWADEGRGSQRKQQIQKNSLFILPALPEAKFSIRVIFPTCCMLISAPLV